MIDEVNQKGKLYNFDENGNATIMEEADVTDPDMPGEMMLLAAGSTTVPVGHSEPTYVSTDEGNTVGITQITLQEEFNKMASSIKKYKGFYIGRFEASLTSDGTKTESKYAVPMMNQNVTWHQMYDVLKKLNTTSNAVTTGMIWGCQWDHMLKTIHGSLDGGGVTYNVGKGHYSRHNTKTNTGENEADKVRNIYDIENTSEITMEANPSKSIRIKRGGDGSAIRPPDGGEPIYSVSASTRTEVSLMGDSYTSRAVLCIK